MASGYIAGGAIAGIIIAFIAGVPMMAGLNERIQSISASNPLYSGPYADVLSLIPFIGLIAILYLTGREILFSGKREAV